MSNTDMHHKYPILWYDEVSSTMDKVSNPSPKVNCPEPIHYGTLITIQSILRHVSCVYTAKIRSSPLRRTRRRMVEEPAEEIGFLPRAISC